MDRVRHKLARTAIGHLRESLVPEGRDARLLGALHFADATGKGVFLSSSAIYFTSVTGLSATQVGIGLSAAGAAGFVASLILGVAADRLGARRLLFAMLLAQSVGFALYPLVGGAAVFYALVTAVGFAEYGGGPAFGSIVASLFEQKDRVRVRAVLRSLFNLGFGLGSGVTALAVLLGGSAVRALPLVTCALLAVSAAMTLRLPAGGTVAGPSTRWFGAVRDLRFMRVAALSAPLALHGSIILVALPLWIVTQTDAPPVLVPILLVSNTVLVVLLQVRTSRGAETVAGAASVAKRSGLWLAGGCLLAAVAGILGSILAALLICVAMLLLTVAELQQAASAWGLAHGLSPESSQAEYLGAFNLHSVAQNVFGPALLVAALGATGSWGWVIVAAVATVAALLMPGAAAAAQCVEPAPAAVR